MSRFVWVQDFSAEENVSARGWASENSIHVISFRANQQGCEILQAAELNHDAHLKTSKMSHTWPRKVVR